MYKHVYLFWSYFFLLALECDTACEQFLLLFFVKQTKQKNKCL